MEKSAQLGNIAIILVILAGLTVGAIAYLRFSPKIGLKPPQSTYSSPASILKTNTEIDKLKSYTSQDLKISFEYPQNWYIDEKDLDVMITSYRTRIGENKSPKENEIKIFIDNFNGCHDTIEENLIDPACGQGGSTVKKNKILSKETRQTKGGTFYKYIVESPNKNFTYYLFEKGDKVLQIEKLPDPSKFEKEFEEIVSAIKFL